MVTGGEFNLTLIDWTNVCATATCCHADFGIQPSRKQPDLDRFWAQASNLQSSSLLLDLLFISRNLDRETNVCEVVEGLSTHRVVVFGSLVVPTESIRCRLYSGTTWKPPRFSSKVIRYFCDTFFKCTYAIDDLWISFKLSVCTCLCSLSPQGP